MDWHLRETGASPEENNAQLVELLEQGYEPHEKVEGDFIELPKDTLRVRVEPPGYVQIYDNTVIAEWEPGEIVWVK